jgi:hypothetical protein
MCRASGIAVAGAVEVWDAGWADTARWLGSPLSTSNAITAGFVMRAIKANAPSAAGKNAAPDTGRPRACSRACRFRNLSTARPSWEAFGKARHATIGLSFREKSQLLAIALV